MSEEENKKNSIFVLMPILFVLCIIPLITRMYIYDPKLDQYAWFVAENNKIVDFFLYYKSIFLVLSLIIMTAILIYYIISKKVKLRVIRIFIPLIFYAILATISSLNSRWLQFSLKGIYEQFESIWVILAYCVLTYYSFVFVKTKQEIKTIFKGWRILLIAISILGLTQALGSDFFQSEIGKRLITPSSYWNSLDTIKFTFEKGIVYLTLYNPNYVGLLASLAIPILVAFIIQAKNRREKIFDSLIVIGLFISVIGSRSKNAFIALIIALLLEIIFFRSKLLKQWKIVSISTILLIAIFLVFNALGGNAYLSSIKNIFLNKEQNGSKLENIITEKSNVKLLYNQKYIYISYETDENNSLTFKFADEKNRPLEYVYNYNSSDFTLKDESFSGLRVIPVNIGEKLGFEVNVNNKAWYFSNQFEDTLYRYYNDLGKWTTIKEVETYNVFPDSFFSGRGYIWNRTLPILKHHFFIGSGADTFSLVFPQEDYVNAYNAGYENAVFTKPHNLYLQIGTQSGVISLLCFLIFYILYFINSIQLYWNKNLDNVFLQTGIAIFFGTIGYMISAIVNDSTITVSPMYWIMIGIGISMNNICKKQLYYIE